MPGRRLPAMSVLWLLTLFLFIFSVLASEGDSSLTEELKAFASRQGSCLANGALSFVDCEIPEVASASSAPEVAQLLRRGTCALHLLEARWALGLALQALELDPTSPYALFLAAKSLEQEERPEDQAGLDLRLRALRAAESLAAGASDALTLSYVEAELAGLAAQLSEAGQAAGRSFDEQYLAILEKDNAEALLFWGRSLLFRPETLRSKPLDGIEELSAELAPVQVRLNRLRKDHPATHVFSLQSALVLGKFDEGVHKALRGLEEIPELRDFLKLLNLRATVALHANQHAEAERLLRIFLGRDACEESNSAVAENLHPSHDELRSRSLLLAALAQGLRFKELRKCALAFQDTRAVLPASKDISWTSDPASAEYFLSLLPALAVAHARLQRWSDASDSFSELKSAVSQASSPLAQELPAEDLELLREYYGAMKNANAVRELLVDRLDSQVCTACDCDSVSGLPRRDPAAFRSSSVLVEREIGGRLQRLALSVRFVEDFLRARRLQGQEPTGAVVLAFGRLFLQAQELSAMAGFVGSASESERRAYLQQLEALGGKEELALRRGQRLSPFGEAPELLAPARSGLARLHMCRCDFASARRALSSDSAEIPAESSGDVSADAWTWFALAQTHLAEALSKPDRAAGLRQEALARLQRLQRDFPLAEPSLGVIRQARKQRAILESVGSAAGTATALSAVIPSGELTPVGSSAAASGGELAGGDASLAPGETLQVPLLVGLLWLLCSLALGALLMCATYTFVLRRRRQKKEADKVKLSYVLSPTTYMRAQEQLSRWASRDLVEPSEVDML